MKIYYDKNSMAIVMDSLHFGGGSLLAEIIENKVWIKHKALDFYENVLNFDQIQKEGGAQAGLNNQEVVDYLNSEFKKGGRSGESYFNGDSLTVTVNADSILIDDIVIVQAASSSLNELIFVSEVFNGGFTVTRSVISGIVGATSGLVFKWIKP